MYLIFVATIYATFCGFDKIDLTYLSSPTDYLNNDTHYHMNICGSVHNSMCKTTSLLCKISNQSVINLADSSSSPLWLHINSSDPTLGIQASYNNGDVCMMNQTYKVNIQYICNKITSRYFEIEKIDNCSYTVRQKVDCETRSSYPSKSFLRSYVGVLIFSAITLPLLIGACVQRYQQCKEINHINWFAARQECLYNIKQLFGCGRNYKDLEGSLSESLNP